VHCAIHCAICQVKLKSRPKSKMSERSRNWCFTLNNYTDEEVESVREKAGGAKYLVFGYEVAPETGTPHLQGYVQFTQVKSLKQMKVFIPRAHFEVARADGGCNKRYTTKDGKFEEFGIPPKTQKEKGEGRWKRVLEKAREGDQEWLEENEPYLVINGEKKLKALKRYKTEAMDYSDADTPHEWWYGPTGTGKSSTFWKNYPDGYPKDTNRWWDDYRGEVVLMEEVDPETMKYLASKMKKWVDRFPFMGETKGGSIKIRPPKIVIISNYTIEECFPEKRDQDAMKRRVKVVKFGEEEEATPWHPSYRKPSAT